MFALFASQKEASISCDLKGIQPIQPSLMHNAARNQRSLRHSECYSQCESSLLIWEAWDSRNRGFARFVVCARKALFRSFPFLFPHSQTGALRQMGSCYSGSRKLPLLAALMRFEVVKKGGTKPTQSLQKLSL